MTLKTGTHLGPYEVLSLIGKGGMGEVYRAKDTKLARDVAIKVLPEAFARDPGRLGCFRREAHVLASLNHPNIAAIYGLEDTGDVHYLVLEFVPGETLAERVKAGPVEIEEALKICVQIADALEAAHEKGVVHRDLKPANVKVTPEGKVKVLDFGLAKALADEEPSGDPGDSPTVTAMPTQPGVILGTASYMSPEQARGKKVDRRADTWAFGCVLYELLTARRAFEGESVAEIIAAVQKVEPDWQALPAETPANIRSLLGRCLRKEAASRSRDAADIRLQIQEVLAVSATTVSAPAPAVPHRAL